MGELDKDFIKSMGPDALYDLGIKYSTGEGTEVDLITAHKWFNLAAMEGSVSAREWRSELSQEMTAADIAKAQRMAREWIAAN